MQRLTITTAASCQRQYWMLAAIAVCTVAFYFVEHSYDTSQYLEVLEESTVELDELVAEGNTSRRIAFAVLGLFGIAAWLCPGRPGYRLLSTGGLVFCSYFAWSFASVLWTDDLGLTVRRFGVLLFMLLAIMGISKQLSPRDLCWLVIGACTLHLVWGIAAEVRLGTFYPWIDVYRFAGTIHPNTQGIQCAAICLAALCLAQDVRRGTWALLWLALFAAGFLVLTKSRTSCAATLVGAAVIWLPHASRWGKATALVLAPFAIGTTLLVAVLMNWDIADRISNLVLMGREEEAGTLTGRLPLWTELLHYVQARPLFGYGYGSFWNVGRMRAISESQGWQIAHSHSAYLETVLNLGILGALLLLASFTVAFGSAFIRSLRTRDAGYRFLTGFIAFAALYSVTDAGFALPNFMSLVLLSGLAVTLFSQRAPAAPAAKPVRVEPMPLESKLPNELSTLGLRN